jgi:hypothetical protein
MSVSGTVQAEENPPFGASIGKTLNLYKKNL